MNALKQFWLRKFSISTLYLSIRDLSWQIVSPQWRTLTQVEQACIHNQENVTSHTRWWGHQILALVASRCQGRCRNL